MTCELIIKGLSSTTREPEADVQVTEDNPILAFTFYSQVLLPDVPRPAAPTQFKINNSHSHSLTQTRTRSERLRIVSILFFHFLSLSLTSDHDVSCLLVTCLWPSSLLSSLSLTILSITVTHSPQQPGGSPSLAWCPPLTGSCAAQTLDQTPTRGIQSSLTSMSHKVSSQGSLYFRKCIRRTLHAGN